MNADASVFWTIRHINFNVEPGVKYRIGGPTISARASVQNTHKSKIILILQINKANGFFYPH